MGTEVHKAIICPKLIFWHQTSSHKCSMCLHCESKVSVVSTKAVVQVDFPAYALSIHKQNTLRFTQSNNSNKTGP